MKDELLETAIQTHAHFWWPDGESWREHIPAEDECETVGGLTKIPKCTKEDHHVLKRRYTCHCGESKVVTLD